MKHNPNVTSSRRKCRKLHFKSPSNIRRKIMSAPLSVNLRNKHNVRSLPVKKHDEVLVVRGNYAGREGKIVQCYRKNWVIYIERVTRNKINGVAAESWHNTVQVGIHPSNLVLTKLKLDEDRLQLLQRKAVGRGKCDMEKRNLLTVDDDDDVDIAA
ncbi:60S ribosomal protein L26-2-like [Beta vulgaris subsp. vulgaris]|uniref:60S ribosomal protein L26-2-like n=1 Tax=Beta vulgaris subsp. vulgaris TaxID=3555 RepID=UPI002549BD89|nr:60S ribosomal protein L26-2-like [Beta vulgaris subsp. vulgaris]